MAALLAALPRRSSTWLAAVLALLLFTALAWVRWRDRRANHPKRES
jgi:hypothetical protein